MSLFVVFEGPEGSGKSTQVRLLEERLVRHGHAVLGTREPGGTRIGEQIRAVLHDVDNRSMLPITEALLYSAARAQLVREVIVPALAAKQIVLCDRFKYSTLAYQGDGRGLDKAMLCHLAEWATDGLEPDLVVYLDLDVTAGLERKRRAQRDEQGEWNRMDQLDITFHQNVRAGYLDLADADKARWMVVDAAKPVSEIHELIWATVNARMDG